MDFRFILFWDEGSPRKVNKEQRFFASEHGCEFDIYRQERKLLTNFIYSSDENIHSLTNGQYSAPRDLAEV